MREILFRAKRVDNGEWVYGYYWTTHIPGISIWSTGKDIHVLRTDCLNDANVLIDPDTLGMCSNLPDDSGHIMYEGDIVCVSNQTSIVGVVCFGITAEVNGVLYEGFFVEWKGEHRKTLRNSLAYWSDVDNITVIGNIHDNPELMGGENDT